MDPEPRKFKYYQTFAAVLTSVPDENRNAYLAKASIEDLRSILPEVGKDSDLLPIAANACVANIGNKNGDVVNTAVALGMYKQFEDKFINVEHDRATVVGCIKRAVLSKFNPNYGAGLGSELIAEDGITEGQPFNISLAGYIWKVVAPGVAKTIVEANDPLNPNFLSMAMSWEVGFDDYKIMVGNQALASSKIIDSSDESFASYDAHLKSRGGTGVAHDGQQVFRLLWGAKPEDVVPLGVGLTFNPAGAVAGIVTSEAKASIEAEKTPVVASAEENSIENEKVSEIISQTAVSNVTNYTIMKTLKSFTDVLALNDESVKEVSIANMANLINAEAERLLVEHSKEIRVKEEAKAAAEAKVQEAAAAAIATAAEIAKLQNELAQVKADQAVASAQSKFNERMAGFDETHVLSPEVRQVVASSINGLTDEAFTTFRKNFDILHKSQSKAAIQEATASAIQQVDTKVTAQEALASATATVVTPPNTVTEQANIQQKLKDAFTIGKGISVK